MNASSRQLEARILQLEQEGAEPVRIELLRRAHRFKRSWLEMAEALSELRQSRRYESWGHEDLYSYCTNELALKKHTVDKLTGNYAIVQRHAPHILQEQDAEQPVPSADAVDYFARAMGERENDNGTAPEHAPEVIEELRGAVFDEGRSVGTLRRQFHETLYPKTPAEVALDAMLKSTSAAQRLVATLPELEGLSQARIAEVETAVAALQADLEALIPAARERASMAQAS